MNLEYPTGRVEWLTETDRRRFAEYRAQEAQRQLVEATKATIEQNKAKGKK